jgi:hypothetical protein
MTTTERKTRLAKIKARIKEFDRIGDVVLRDQEKRSYQNAKDSWTHRPEQGFSIIKG